MKIVNEIIKNQLFKIHDSLTSKLLTEEKDILKTKKLFERMIVCYNDFKLDEFTKYRDRFVDIILIDNDENENLSGKISERISKMFYEQFTYKRDALLKLNEQKKFSSMKNIYYETISESEKTKKNQDLDMIKQYAEMIRCKNATLDESDEDKSISEYYERVKKQSQKFRTVIINERRRVVYCSDDTLSKDVYISERFESELKKKNYIVKN